MTSPPEPGTLSAARITIAFVVVYGTALLLQIITKQRLILEHKRLGKPFNRYTSEKMHSSDRMLANLQEWGFAFLPLLLTLAATDRMSGSVVAVSWIYVGLRGLYVGLVYTFGVGTGGLNPSLWISTFPGYACLLFLMTKAIPLLFSQ